MSSFWRGVAFLGLILPCYSNFIQGFSLQFKNGCPCNSRMVVHAIHTLSCLSDKTFEWKLKLVNCFGFFKDEGPQKFKRIPTLFRTSEKKSKVGWNSSCIQVRCPSLSLFTMDGRMLSWWSFPAVEIKKSLQESPQLYSCVVLVWGDVLGQVYITIQKKCSGVIIFLTVFLTVLCKLNLVSYIFKFFFETGLPYILSFYSSKSRLD